MSFPLYTNKKTYINGGTPALNSTNLNSTEDQIEDITNFLIADESAEQESSAEITTLPSSNIVQGELVNTIEGKTIVNILDPDDAGLEATTGWNFASIGITTDSTDNLEGTNCLKLTLGGATGYIYKDFLSRLDKTKNYLISAYVKNEDLSGLGIRLEVDTDTGSPVVSSYVIGTKYTRISVVVQASYLTSATYFRVYFRLDGASTEFAFIDALMINKVTTTEYGLGADAILSRIPFHRGMKGSKPCRVKSVGVNLFKRILEQGNISTTSGNNLTQTNILRNVGYVKVSAGTQYTLYTDVGFDVFNIHEYDAAFKFITSTIGGGLNTKSITTNANTTYLRFTFVTDGGATNPTIVSDLDDYDIQLERGSSATTYQPYTETKAYIPELNSVPAIGDDFEVDSGKLTKNVEANFTLLSAHIDSVADGTNLQRVIIGLDAFTGIKTQTASTIDLETIVTGFISETNGFDTVGDDNKWYTDATNLYILVALGTYADVAAARTALTSTVTTLINYQLATPEVTYLPKQNLIGYPSGTTYNEHIIKEQLVYGSTGLVITNTNYPISSLESVTKINLLTDEETSIDISTCTIASDGLSFTISTATVGETYRFEYEYQFLSSRSIQKYIYPITQKAQSDSNTKMIKQVDDKVVNLSDSLKQWKLYDNGATTGAVSTLSIAVPKAKLIKIIINPFTPSVTGTLGYVNFNSDGGANYGYSGIANSSSIVQGAGATQIVIGSSFGVRNSTLEIDITQKDTFDKIIKFAYAGGNAGNEVGGGFGSWSNIIDWITTLDLSFNDTTIASGVSYEVYYYDGLEG